MRTHNTSPLIAAAICLCILNAQPAQAEQDSSPLCFSPIIIVDTIHGQGGSKALILQPQAQNESRGDSANYGPKPNELSIGDLDEYSLALGAKLHINDRFNIGAACGLPLKNEETLQMDDITIEAMVTMQF